MTRLLLASDFDGTLAAIREDPTSVAIDPEALRAFARAAAVSGVEIAIISGRDVDDLRGRAGGLRAWYAGSHGHEIVAPDGATVRSTEPWRGTPDREWLARATAAGLRLEPKKYGIGLHWRGVEGVEREHPVVREFEAWAEDQGLELIPGRCVVEASIPGATKHDVLAHIAGATGASRVIYAGDDLTDFGALRWAAAHGRAFFLASAERKESPGEGVERLSSRAELIGEIEREVGRARG